ncbi:MAG: TonB-dependent receptor [Rikenellaceae bacterium]
MKHILRCTVLAAVLNLCAITSYAQEEEYYTDSSLQSVEVFDALNANYISSSSIAKNEVISFAGLCKMACCNLAESFENSASVTVGFSDAISGARQIQLLGLAGSYVQILDESRPIMRGLSAPYGLSYTPGMWLNSIQVSKGIASVTSGHETITGEINLEHRKPTDEERLFLNLYLNSELRPELNLSTAQPVGKSGRLSTVVLAHISADTDVVTIDHNGDGFRDTPSMQQYNISNRWSYIANSGVQLRWGVKLLEDRRLGGMLEYDDSQRATMVEDNIYGSQINNRSMNGYFKLGAPVGKEVGGQQSNIAVVADYDYFSQDSYFGINDYVGSENSASLTMIYNHYFTPRSSLKVGVSSRYQSIYEQVCSYDLSRDEAEVGVYAEYTYKLGDKLSAIAGVREDYNSYFDSYIFTPRGHLKWSITPTSTLRASAGVGHRTANIITDNIGVLATGRELLFETPFADMDRQERALTLGGSFTQSFKILRAADATFSIDYFRTSFMNTVVIDQEWDSSTMRIYNTSQKATTDTYQADLTWTPLRGFDIFTTFRYTRAMVTLTRNDGSYYYTERPLTSKYKGLLNLQYATLMRRWVFDVTAQINGSSRLPVQDGVIQNSEYSPSYPMFYAQASRRVGAWEIYAGCENIGNYTQANPIISADSPFSTEFNSSVVWGPLMGRKFYIGVRFNLY